jgi:hypothetical protein
MRSHPARSSYRTPQSTFRIRFGLMPDPNPQRKSRVPLMDALGKLIIDGKQSADYLWQVPDDQAMRAKILTLLDQIGAEGARQGRKEMPKIAEELKTAAKASPSPQQVDLLVNGFDRLLQLWEAAKSGLL